MTAFRYRAVNFEGGEITGVVEAETARQARGNLKNQGLLALEVTAQHGKASGAPVFGSKRISPQAVALLTRQWATLLEAGMTVEQGLAALIEQTDEAAVRQTFLGVKAELMAGHPLHVALASFPKSFDELYRAVIEAGEQSGQLSLVMVRLADMLEAAQALRQKVIQAMVYPAVIVVVAFAVVMGLMTYVVPQVVSVFQHGKQALPWLTRSLMATSDFLRLAWPVLLFVSIAGGWSFRRMLRVPAFRLRWHRRLMGLPGVGRLLVSIDSSRLAQTLAVLIGSGVPMLSALAACRAVMGLEPLRQGVDQGIKMVREGVSLHRGLAECRHFPPLLLHMIASGEASGRLDGLLERAARQQQTEVANRLSMAVSLLEPLLILVMGGIVLLIVVAILQPIIEINQLLR